MQEAIKTCFCMYRSQQWCAKLLYFFAETMYEMLFDLETKLQVQVSHQAD